MVNNTNQIIELTDGRKINKKIDFFKGDFRNPLTQEELEEKFKRCTRKVLQIETVYELLKKIMNSEKLENVGSIFAFNISRPYWSGPFWPVFFTLSALLAGTAALVLLIYLTDYFTNGKKLKAENEKMFDAFSKLLALFVGLIAGCDIANGKIPFRLNAD